MELHIARTRRQRTQGLLGRETLAPDEALLIPRCRWVHTIGMRFPIQIAFLAADGRILESLESVPPGRLLRPRLRARHVLETAARAPLPARIGVPGRAGSGYT